MSAIRIKQYVYITMYSLTVKLLEMLYIKKFKMYPLLLSKIPYTSHVCNQHRYSIPCFSLLRVVQHIMITLNNNMNLKLWQLILWTLYIKLNLLHEQFDIKRRSNGGGLLGRVVWNLITLVRTPAISHSTFSLMWYSWDPNLCGQTSHTTTPFSVILKLPAFFIN